MCFIQSLHHKHSVFQCTICTVFASKTSPLLVEAAYEFSSQVSKCSSQNLVANTKLIHKTITEMNSIQFSLKLFSPSIQDIFEQVAIVLYLKLCSEKYCIVPPYQTPLKWVMILLYTYLRATSSKVPQTTSNGLVWLLISSNLKALNTLSLIYSFNLRSP